MAQVFISYNKRDRALVERIRDALADAGLSVWWDDNITPREYWDHTLEREIGAANYVLVLWTENSIDSKWVRTEVAWTNKNNPGALVQARFDDAPLPMLAYLNQYIDLDRDEPQRSPGWPKLLEWLGVAAPRQAARMQARPAPAPASPPARPPVPVPSGPNFGFIALTWLLVVASCFGLVNGVTNFGEIGDDSRPGYGVSNLVESLILVCQAVGLIGFIGTAILKRWALKVQALFLGSGLVLLAVARFSTAEVMTVALVGGLLLLLPYYGIRKGWMS